ncbi:unnamed protein product [Lampetra planeri]
MDARPSLPFLCLSFHASSAPGHGTAVRLKQTTGRRCAAAPMPAADTGSDARLALGGVRSESRPPQEMPVAAAGASSERH